VHIASFTSLSKIPSSCDGCNVWTEGRGFLSSVTKRDEGEGSKFCPKMCDVIHERPIRRQTVFRSDVGLVFIDVGRLLAEEEQC